MEQSDLSRIDNMKSRLDFYLKVLEILKSGSGDLSFHGVEGKIGPTNGSLENKKQSLIMYSQLNESINALKNSIYEIRNDISSLKEEVTRIEAVEEKQAIDTEEISGPKDEELTLLKEEINLLKEMLKETQGMIKEPKDKAPDSPQRHPKVPQSPNNPKSYNSLHSMLQTAKNVDTIQTGTNPFLIPGEKSNKFSASNGIISNIPRQPTSAANIRKNTLPQNIPGAPIGSSEIGGNKKGSTSFIGKKTKSSNAGENIIITKRGKKESLRTDKVHQVVEDKTNRLSEFQNEMDINQSSESESVELKHQEDTRKHAKHVSGNDKPAKSVTNLKNETNSSESSYSESVKFDELELTTETSQQLEEEIPEELLKANTDSDPLSDDESAQLNIQETTQPVQNENHADSTEQNKEPETKKRKSILSYILGKE